MGRTREQRHPRTQYPYNELVPRTRGVSSSASVVKGVAERGKLRTFSSVNYQQHQSGGIPTRSYSKRRGSTMPPSEKTGRY